MINTPTTTAATDDATPETSIRGAAAGESEPTITDLPTITADLVRRYDRPGPRYTSYPTAVSFDDSVGAAAYGEHLARAAEKADQPIGLYLHLPFCAERCLYCGCNVVITKKRQVAAHYLGVLETELRSVAERLGSRRRVRQLHWGGGTPTYFTPDEMRRLHATVASLFSLEDDAEVAIEVDPRVTSPAHLDTLADLGFNRLSVGVQDFTTEVQARINRIQPFEDTRALLEDARRLGFESINVDLIYGLPLQTPETFQLTLEQVVSLRPARVAVYSYAHVPWLKVQQRRIEASELPAPEVKLELIANAIEAFRAAGYRAIGMDHFALPEDELGEALEAGTLWRNFMGYTVRHAPDLVGCGMSAIGDVDGTYVANHRKLSGYQKAIEAGQLAVDRGYVLAADDHLRRYVITALMCTMRLDFAEVERRFGLDASAVFQHELEALKPFEDDGLVALHRRGIEVIGLGRLFVRNICMVFDTFLGQGESQPQRFSRTV